MDPRIRIHNTMSWIRNTDRRVVVEQQRVARAQVSRVADPDPDSIGSVDPDPGGQK